VGRSTIAYHAPMLEGRRVSAAALLLLPAGLLLYLAFNAGGFYPGAQAFVAMFLCVVLLLRVTLADNPFAGFSRSFAVAAGALSLLALLTILSGSWSHSPGRALVEFDLPLVYLVVMILFGSVASNRQRLEWALATVTVAIFVICTAGLITRILPHLWPTSPNVANNRLSYPVTYWNTLGLLAALGLVLCLHFSSQVQHPRVVRVTAGAAMPVLAATLFFTFSRASILCCFIALIAYALLGRPRGLLSALLAAIPPIVVAVTFSYDADLLSTPTPTTSAAVGQGHRVTIAVLACVVGAAVLRTLLLRLDDRLGRFSLAPDLRGRVVRVAWGSTAAIVLILVVAFNGTIRHQYHRFVHSTSVGNATDLRARLTDPGNNGRIDMWNVSWHEFKAAALVGHGAGTFVNTWDQHRPTTDDVRDAHSLYMETLDELGIVGFLLLVTVMLTILVRTVTRARGPSRPLYAAVFAVLLAWAVHAGVDWDWEMPVVGVIFFSLGGFMLAGSGDRPARAFTLTPQGRTLVGLGCVMLAVGPAYVWLSQRRLDSATYAFSQGDCTSATRYALSSISILGSRPDPYEIVSYCDVRRGMPEMAIAAMDKAIKLDPNNWNYRYGLALMEAAAGIDPRPAVRKALSLNSRESLVQAEWQTFRTGGPQQWEIEGKRIASQFTSL
jgi:hypothetical protein